MKAYTKELIKANYQQVLFVVVAFLAMVLVSYFYVSDIVRKEMLALGEETMNTTQTAVSASLAESELTFANMTENLDNMLSQGSSNEEILQYLRDTNQHFGSDRSSLPDFLKVYAYIRDEFLDGSGWVPPDDYYPPDRPWYIGAMESGEEIYFSEPYVDADTGGMCISFSQQLFDDEGNSYGVAAIDLNLTRITDYIAGQQIANDGYGVLVDDTMQFTSHRDSSLISENMQDVSKDYAMLADMLQSGQPIAAVRFTDVDGTDSIAFFRTIFNGWHIGIMIPRASYYQEVTNLAVVLTILGVGLMTVLSYMLIRTRVEKMRADEDSRSKSSFLARMSHEMRTPMNAIIGMTGIAEKSGDMEKVQDCLHKIDDAANHLLGVINDVLDMSKIEAGKLELSETIFPFESMLSQVITVSEFRIEEKHQHFTVDIAQDVPGVIIADKQRLAQVITNLLSNANKFTEEGGNIALRVRKLGEQDGKSILEFEVADDGIGISPEQQARLFRSFEQADGSISRKYGGTGLGLVISKQIVDMMGGGVQIISAPGEGSRFIFTISVGIGTEQDINDTSALPGMPVAQEDTQLSLKGRRILLAEDVAVNREILIALLEDTGVQIDSAENGREACEMFAKDPDAYDMVFMDIHMPEVDGYEATRCIRSMDMPRAKTIPIVAMTANVFKEDIDKCLAAGMDGHVGKPLEINEVFDSLKKYMPPS